MSRYVNAVEGIGQQQEQSILRFFVRWKDTPDVSAPSVKFNIVDERGTLLGTAVSSSLGEVFLPGLAVPPGTPYRANVAEGADLGTLVVSTITRADVGAGKTPVFLVGKLIPSAAPPMPPAEAPGRQPTAAELRMAAKALRQQAAGLRDQAKQVRATQPGLASSLETQAIALAGQALAFERRADVLEPGLPWGTIATVAAGVGAVGLLGWLILSPAEKRRAVPAAAMAGLGRRRRKTKMTRAARRYIESKIKKLHKEGFRGRQLVRVAYEMARKAGYKVPAMPAA